jgi:hypothetical protein
MQALELVSEAPETPRVDPPLTPRPTSAPARDRTPRERRSGRRRREAPAPEAPAPATPAGDDGEGPRPGRRVDLRV